MRYLILIIFLLLCQSANAANNYLLNTDVISPDSVSVPAKGGTHTDTTTGATWKRMSTYTELGGTNTDSQIVYSRYSASNSNGQYLLVHGTNSTSCFVYRLSDNALVTDLKRDSTHQIGELNEIRWDYTGNYPNRIYFVNGMSFYYMDAVSGNESPTLIRDFSSDFPNGVQIINDVEGDSSADSRYWAWYVRGAYVDGNYPVIHIFTYDKQTNTILGQLDVGDVTPTQNASNWTTRFPRPNMVEISPTGDYVHTNFGRSYTGSTTQDWAGTAFDGPHVWHKDFSGTPVRVGRDEEHSGWGFLANGTEVFVSKDGSVDKFQACRTDGVGGAYPNNCFYFFDYSTGDYYGHHWARMPESAPGWILISTYSYLGTADKWQEEQLIMLELLAEASNPRAWRISPMYNEYEGDYRDEASAAISQDGNKIYVTTNWMSVSNHGEAYEIDITGWKTHFGIGGKTPSSIASSGTPLSSSPTGTPISILE